MGYFMLMAVELFYELSRLLSFCFEDIYNLIVGMLYHVIVIIIMLKAIFELTWGEFIF